MERSTRDKFSSFVFGLLASILIIWGSAIVSDSYYFNSVTDDLVKRKDELAGLKRINDENEKIRDNMVALEQSLAQTEQEYNKLKVLIPTEAELPVILNWIEKAALDRNLKLELFSQSQPKPLNQTFVEMPIQVDVAGYYDQVSRYLEDFARLPRIIQVNSVRMAQDRTPSPDFTVHASINISAFIGKEIRVSNNK